MGARRFHFRQMAESNWKSEDTRLATQIRTNARVTLGVTLAAVLLGWAALSAVQGGVRQMEGPEHKLLTRYPDLFQKPLGSQASNLESLDTLEQFEELVRVQRNLCEGLLYGTFSQPTPPNKTTLRMKEQCPVLLQDIADFEDKELETFGIQATVPYVKTHALDARFIGRNAWPFLLVGLVVVLLMTHSRRRAYEQILAYRSSGAHDEPARRALAEFFVRKLSKCPNGGCGVRVYAKVPILLPESGVLLILLAALAWESLGLFGILDPIVAQDFDSLFFGYFPFLWLAVWIGAVLVAGARKYFARSVTAVVGSPVVGAGFHRLLHKLPRQTAYLFSPLPNARTIRAWLATAIAVVGLVSLAFPWVHPWQMRGFEIFAKETPATPAQLAPFFLSGVDKVVLPIDLDRLFELRLLVAAGIALLLLIAMTTIVDLKSKRKKLKRILGKTVRFASWGALLLAGDVVSGLELLELRAEAWMIPLSRADILKAGAPGGLPLMYSDPDYGAWIFIVCCVVLAFFAILGAKAFRTNFRRKPIRNQVGGDEIEGTPGLCPHKE